MSSIESEMTTLKLCLRILAEKCESLEKENKMLKGDSRKTPKSDYKLENVEQKLSEPLRQRQRVDHTWQQMKQMVGIDTQSRHLKPSLLLASSEHDSNDDLWVKATLPYRTTKPMPPNVLTKESCEKSMEAYFLRPPATRVRVPPPAPISIEECREPVNPHVTNPSGPPAPMSSLDDCELMF